MAKKLTTFGIVLCLAVVIACAVHKINAQSGAQGLSGNQGTAGMQGGAVITGLTLSPLTPSTTVGAAIGYTATASYSDSTTGNVTSAATWFTNNSAIISAIGLSTGSPQVENVQCNAAGTGSVSVLISGFSASTTQACTSVPPPPPTLVSIAVSPVSPSVSVGQSVGMTATGTYSDGSKQDVTAGAVWASGTPSVATIGTLGTQQNVNCIAAGTSSITATIGAVVSPGDTVTCNAVLSSISVNPSTASITVGQTQGFTATGHFSDGSVQDITLQATWSSSATSVATVASPVVDPEIATGLTAGTSTITAAVGTVNNTATLTVTAVGPPPPTISSITLGPANPTINVGSTVGEVATCTYSDNSTKDCTLSDPISGTATVWASGTPAVATVASPVVDPEIVTAVSVGTSIISATIGANLGSTTVTVQNPTPTLSSVALSPLIPTVTVGSSIGEVATCTYSDGSTKDCTLKDPLHGTTTVWSSSATAIATVASPVVDPETVSCAAVGTSTITATLGATSGNTVITCQATQPPNLGNDAYEAPGNVCSFGSTDSFANLPTTCYYTNPTALPSGGTLRNGLSTNALFNAAATAAACGDILEIPQGTSLTNITFPLKACDSAHYITIRTSGFASLPTYGNRVTPCNAGVQTLPGRNYPCSSPSNVMAQITTTSTASPLTLTSGSGFIRLLGVELARPENTTAVSALLSINGSNHIVLDHVWCHGDEAGGETTSCFGVTNTTFVAAVDSYMNDFYCVSAVGACTDAHPIGGGINNAGGCSDATYKFVDNYLEGAAQSILMGGGAAQCTPADMDIRNNEMAKPFQWDPACTVALCGIAYNGGFQGGNPVITKNIFELKNAQRVLFEGNWLHNVWAGFSQPGTAVLITPKNQASGGLNVCPLCETLDVTIRYNYISSAANPITKANAVSDAGGSPTAGKRYSIHDNVGDNLLYQACYKCSGGNADAQTLTASSAVLQQVNNQHNTWVLAANPLTKLAGDFGISGPLASPGPQMSQANFLNDLLSPSISGISNPSDGCSGTITNCACNNTTPTQILNACFSSYQFGGNAVVGNSVSGWPGVNCLNEPSFTSIFGNYNNGIWLPGGDFHVRLASPCHNSGTDGKDPGADINTLLNRLQWTGLHPSGGPSANPNWVQIPTSTTGTLLDNFDIKQSNNHWFLADRNNGIYISTNQGASWSPINTGLPTKDCTSLGGTSNGVCGWTVQVNPATGDIIANLAGPSAGTSHFYRSTNEGASWTQIPEPVGFSINRGSFSGPLMPPVGGGPMILSGAGASGGTVMYSNNNGANTTLSTESPLMGNAESTGVNSSVFGAGGENGGFQTSTNGGAAFTAVWNCQPTGGPLVGPSCGNVLDSTEIYSQITDGQGNWVISTRTGVWKSGGPITAPTSWTQLYASSTRDRAVFRDSLGSYYFGQAKNGSSTNNTVTRSIDGGKTWQEWDAQIGVGLEAHKFVENQADGRICAVIENGATNTGALWCTPK